MLNGTKGVSGSSFTVTTDKRRPKIKGTKSEYVRSTRGHIREFFFPASSGRATRASAGVEACEVHIQKNEWYALNFSVLGQGRSWIPGYTLRHALHGRRNTEQDVNCGHGLHRRGCFFCILDFS